MWYVTTIIVTIYTSLLCAVEIITSSIVFPVNQNKPLLPSLSVRTDTIAACPALPAAVMALT